MHEGAHGPPTTRHDLVMVYAHSGEPARCVAWNSRRGIMRGIKRTVCVSSCSSPARASRLSRASAHPGPSELHQSCTSLL